MRYKKLLYTLLFMGVASFSLNVAVANDIYKVTQIGQGSSLKLHAYPANHSRVVVSIPHNASWVIKRQKRAQRKIDDVLWHKVTWNGHQGWVKNKFLSKDIISTRQLKQRLGVRQQCLNNNVIKDKTCCGYTRNPNKNFIAKRIDMYAIKGVAKGNTIALRSAPGKWTGKVLVAIPHSAKWIVGLPNVKKLPNGQTWQQVRWGAKTGWVNKKYIHFDEASTQIGEKRRKQCN